MKRDAAGRVSYTERQREALLDEFERSGLKGSQFALAAGVKYQTFAHWAQLRRHARGDYGQKGRTQDGAQALRLVEAVAAAPAVPPDAPGFEAGTLEVLLPGGAKMLIAGARQVTLAAKLIQALARSC